VTSRLARLGATLAVAAFAVGCGTGGLRPPLSFAAGYGSTGVRVPVAPPTGYGFAHQSAPIETNFEATPVGSREGEAVIYFLQDPIFTGLPIVTFGDASLAEAIKDGGLQTVHYADYHIVSVLGIYVQLTLRVSGD